MKWEITIIKVSDLYKVTRRIPALRIQETFTFSSKEDAVKQFEAWLSSEPLTHESNPDY